MDCSCEEWTYWGILTCTLAGFIIQISMGSIAGSAALRADAWHTLFDGSDAILSLLVLFLIRHTNHSEDDIRQKGAVISLLLLVVAIVNIGVAAYQKFSGDIVSDPRFIVLGGMVGIVVGRAALYFSSYIPSHRRTKTLHMAHAHVHMDYLNSWGVTVSGLLVWFLSIPQIDGAMGAAIAVYLAYSFLPKYFSLIVRR